MIYKPKYTIAEAIRKIERGTLKRVTYLVPEDGSGRTFIYRFAGDTEDRFIRLT
jgi:hypothetical protein